MRKVLYIFGLLTDADIEWMARTGTRRRLQRTERSSSGKARATDSPDPSARRGIAGHGRWLRDRSRGSVSARSSAKFRWSIRRRRRPRSRRAARASRSSSTGRSSCRSSTAMRASAPVSIARWRCSSPIACVRPANPRAPISWTRIRLGKTSSTRHRGSHLGGGRAVQSDAQDIAQSLLAGMARNERRFS